jgi:hypothetical protein
VDFGKDVEVDEAEEADEDGDGEVELEVVADGFVLALEIGMGNLLKINEK